MVTETPVTPAALKQAIEQREAQTLIGFYADHATMRIIDRDHPPSKPLEIKGRAAIARYYEDVCGRAMSHRIESAVGDGAHMAFVEACAYPDGMRVCCSAMLDIEGGKIVRQTAVQAWDG